jgi:hypothetical protein
MAKLSSVRVVDFVPQYDIFGDIKKVSESNYSIQNLKVVAIVILLYTESGSNVLMPEMGLREVLLSIPYQDINETYRTMDIINSHIRAYTGYQTRAYIDENDPNTNIARGEISIRIDIEGIIEPLEVNVDKSHTIFVKHPSLFTGK